jgi:F0F1-type ATP synthase assembly protein I
MSQNSKPPVPKRGDYAFNLTLAIVAGQVGCLTLIIVIAALFAGLWLDSRMGTRPMFTISLMIISIPVTLFVMVWTVRAATSRMQSSRSKRLLSDEREESISEQRS